MYWWSQLDSDDRKKAENCKVCLLIVFFQPNNWNSWPESYFPWECIHADFCGLFLNRYRTLVLIDSYSKWSEVLLTGMPTTSFVIRLEEDFGHGRIPQVLDTENRPQCWLDPIWCRHLRTAARHLGSSVSMGNWVGEERPVICQSHRAS